MKLKQPKTFETLKVEIDALFLFGIWVIRNTTLRVKTSIIENGLKHVALHHSLTIVPTQPIYHNPCTNMTNLNYYIFNLYLIARHQMTQILDLFFLNLINKNTREIWSKTLYSLNSFLFLIYNLKTQKPNGNSKNSIETTQNTLTLIFLESQKMETQKLPKFGTL